MEQKKNNIVTKRALLILIIFLVGVSVLFSRFVYIQAEQEIQGQDLQTLLESRWSQSRVLEGRRGTIFDRNGEALAEEIPSYTIVANLDERYGGYVEDPAFTAMQLSTVLDIDPAVVEGILTRGIEQGRVQVELGARTKFLSYETTEEVRALELQGINFREDARRYYPKQTFASHIIGYTERDMSVARMGLESSLNEYLQEENGRISYQKDGRNRRLPNANEIIDPPKNGSNVFLTLDTRIQMAIEQTMNQVEQEFEPERIMAIVANAKTGEILGMSNRPSFNPNQYESIVNFINYNTASRFEPGSTLKIFTLAAAIEEGVYRGEDYFLSGSYTVGSDTINDHYRGGWGEITYNEGFERSSNVAFTKLALEELGADRLYEYIDRFGFSQPTGIDLPNEISGSIARRGLSELATTAFGQGTAVTPIQQVQAATAIANDGKMMKPFVIDRIESGDDGEVIKQNEPEIAGQPISKETADEVLRLMETVVTSEVGTGRPFAIDGFRVAGKTGTAEIPRENGRGYLEGHGNFIYSFIGMAPAEDPEVIVYVAVDRPKLQAYESGSLPVSMIFKSVMNQSLQYLNISPDNSNGEQVIEEREIEDVIGLNTEDAKNNLISTGYDVVVLGDGNQVKRQYPQPESKIMRGEKVFILTDGNTFLMPDISGWSLRNVLILQNMLDIQLDIQGNGFVNNQRPEPGDRLDDIDRIMVSLRPPGERDDGEDGYEDTIDTISSMEEEDEDEEFFMD
ncbi:penicillin-binding protein 2B [Evansella vedderi]|uniref:serine-type D-Ala-D-Ala carboxypeptidase n=1 Tax=Evansella vedderi TaxID=38282 RepID=A0ABT9ZTL8_9BACI|nr:PASTA domain-containing penicillin-binding protein [Evansella vedderi]MDQ0253823.1 penicillin-binding protein 2B [Evansella vedderi]